MRPNNVITPALGAPERKSNAGVRKVLSTVQDLSYLNEVRAESTTGIWQARIVKGLFPRSQLTGHWTLAL